MATSIRTYVLDDLFMEVYEMINHLEQQPCELIACEPSYILGDRIDLGKFFLPDR
jgi:hypothetical protein